MHTTSHTSLVKIVDSNVLYINHCTHLVLCVNLSSALDEKSAHVYMTFFARIMNSGDTVL